MFKRLSFQRRMQSYIVCMIMVAAFLSLSTAQVWYAQHLPAATIQEYDGPVEYELIDASDVHHFEPVELLTEFDVEEEVDEELVEYESQHDKGYDGVLVASTSREYITMQIVDGVKHFTNHLIG